MKIFNTHKKLSLIVIISSIMIGACTERINLPFDSTYTRLVVDGAITTDTTAHKVLLSRSNDALNKNEIVYVSNAVVTISDGTTVFPLTENSKKHGLYETQPNVFGQTGKKYTLNVSNVDVNDDGVLESYSASSEIKSINVIDSITFFYQQFGPETGGWLINLYGWDNGGRNYYLTKAYKNGVLLTDSLKEYGKANNAGFDGKYYPGFSVYFLNNNKIDERVKEGDTITLELDNITEDYYNFIDGFQQEYQPKNPIFGGPSANVLTNIEPKDKAVGYFAAYSKATCTRKFKIPALK
jgi:hypothetical protein